ncbi:Putative hydrolase [Mycobacteroides abscessus]|nr:Putative hydrolase [Mycobacteroides abscessus]
MNPITLIENVFAATVDKSRREIADARVVIEGGRIAAVLTAGENNPWQELPGVERVDGSGCLLTPGLVNRITICTSGSPAGLPPITRSSNGLPPCTRSGRGSMRTACMWQPRAR